MKLPEVGETFQTKYKLQSILGRGGFAAVYRATDTQIGRDVAIKILAPGGEGYESDLVSRFMREARVIASLQDPHTITMFDFGRTEEGLLFMVFEYVKGADLSDKLGESGRLDPQRVVHVLLQLLSALREAHGAGILHRDLKPANVLLYQYMGDDYRVKLLDFGIAKPVETGGLEALSITKTGAVVGTPRYMSPEQICSNDLGPPADIYSLGLMAYEMLVGRPAIGGSDTKAILLAQLSSDPIRLPPDLGVDPHLARIVERMCARDPSFRFSSAQEVIDALQPFAPRRLRTTGSGRRSGEWAHGAVPPPNDAQPKVPTQSGRHPVSPTMREISAPNPRPSEPSQTITLDKEIVKSAATNILVVILGVALGAGLIIMILSFVMG